MADLFRELITARRAAPQRDLLSELVALDDAGDRLSEDELVATCILLLFAGHETTTHHLANGLLALLRFPDELMKLRANRALAPAAVEELLRYDGPIGAQVRIVQEAHTLHGRQLKPGDRVFLLMNAANRDPRAYDEPDRVDLTRNGVPHLTFGFGMHICLGFPLARLEGQVALPAVLARWRRLELASQRARVDGFDGVAGHESDAGPGDGLSAEPDHLPRRLWWVLASLTLAWGFNWTAMKTALSEVPPWTFRSLCLGLGSAVLFLALRAGGQRLVLPTGQWGRLCLLALLNITCWNMLVAFGVGMIPSGRAAILAYTMPVWAVPLSVWLLGERITGRKLFGLALGIGGLALLLGEAMVNLGAAPLGSLLVLGASLSWALGTVLQKRFPVRMPVGPYTAWIMLLGGVPIFWAPSRSRIGARCVTSACPRGWAPLITSWWPSPSPTGRGSRSRPRYR